jgi:cytochrome c oxidase subunit 4
MTGPEATTQPPEHAPTARSYAVALLSLLVLLVASVAAAELPWARLALAIALLIASVKAAIVLFVFMEVRNAGATTRTVLAVCLFTAAVLFGLSGVDWVDRSYALDPASGPTNPRNRAYPAP